MLDEPRAERACSAPTSARSGPDCARCPGSSSASMRPRRACCLPIRATHFGMEQAVISMLAGDVFGTPEIGRRLAAYKVAVLFFFASQPAGDTRILAQPPPAHGRRNSRAGRPGKIRPEMRTAGSGMTGLRASSSAPRWSGCRTTRWLQSRMDRARREPAARASCKPAFDGRRQFRRWSCGTRPGR